MTSSPAPTPPSPYGDHAHTYHRAGWSPLPLPPAQKSPVPAGWTGRTPHRPSGADIHEWTTNRPDSNLALRLPGHVLGVDVDAYGDKPGALVIAEHERTLGPLPPTWRTTSRDDGQSGIRLYRVPEGLAWPGILGPGVETIHAAHRYVVAPPSVHPLGGIYRWHTPDGAVAIAGHLPTPDELPHLPQAWVAKFGTEPKAVPEKTGLTGGAAHTWLTSHGQGAPCGAMQHAITTITAALTTPGASRHDTALTGTRRLTALAAEGHTGCTPALAAIQKAWEAATNDSSRIGGADGAAAEWVRMVVGAIDLAAATGLPVPTTDPCTDPFAGLIPPGAAKTPPLALPGGATSDTAVTPSIPISGSAVPMASPAAVNEETPEAESDTGAAIRARLVAGGAYILDIPDRVPAIWGHGDEVLWAAGEALTICGPAGVGKTTLTGQLVRARLEGGEVLGYPVETTQSRVLYLAMDRPRQIARALRRTLGDLPRHTLDERLIVWPGPPLADVAQYPETLLYLCELAGADTVIIDSLKDAAIGLSDDKVGAGYNRARQICIAAGVEVLEQHHMIKRGDNGSPPNTLNDMYGSVWIGNGAGSVINLHGVTGDPVVQMKHLKSPAEEVGPYRLLHDHAAGITTIYHAADLVEMARLAGVNGISAKDAASALTEGENPTSADKEKARRRLDKLTASGRLERVEGRRDSYRGGSPEVRWLWVPDILPPVDNSSIQSHDHSHAPSYPQALTESHPQSRTNLGTPENQGFQSHAQSHASHGAQSHARTPPFREGGAGRVTGERVSEEAEEAKPAHLVERTVAGRRVHVDLHTGEVIEP